MRNYIGKEELEEVSKNSQQIYKICFPESLFFEDIVEYKKINNAASVDDLYNDLIYDRKIKSGNITIISATYSHIKSIPIKSIDNINNFVEELLVDEYENFIKDKFNTNILPIETCIKLPDDENFIREFIEETYDILDCSLNINSLFEQIIVPIYPSMDRDLLDKLFNITRSAILLGLDNSYKINSRLTEIPSISIDEKLKEFDVVEEKLYFRNSIRFTETHKLESSYCLLQKQNYSLDSLCVYSKSINSVRNIEDKRLILKVGDEVIFNIKGFITNNSAYSILKVYINSLDSIKNVNLHCFNYNPSDKVKTGVIPTKFYFNKLEISKDFNPAFVSIDTSLTIGSKEGEDVDITYGFEGVEIPELRFRKNVAFKRECLFKSSTIGNCIDLNKTKFCDNVVNTMTFKDAVINRISTSDNSTNFLSESIKQVYKEAFYRLSVKENPSNLKINLENLTNIFFNAFLISGIEFEKNQNLKSLAYLEEGSICKGKFGCISFNGNSKLKSLKLNSFPGCTIDTLDLRGSRIERLEGSGVLDIKINNLYIDGNITKYVDLETNVKINNLYMSGGETFRIKECRIVGDLVIPESIKNLSIRNCIISKVIFDKKVKLRSLELVFEGQPKSTKNLINFDKVINNLSNLAFDNMFKNGRNIDLFLNGIKDIEYSTFYKIYEYLFYYSNNYGYSPFVNLSIINKKDEALTNSNKFNASYNFNCKDYCVIKDGIRKLNIVNPSNLFFDDSLRLFPSVEEVEIQSYKKKPEVFINLFQAENVKKLTVDCKLKSPQICSNTKNTSLEEINLAYESILSGTVFYPAAFRRDLKVNVDVDGTGDYCDINMIELIIDDIQDSIPKEAKTNINAVEIFLLACPKDIIVVFDNLKISSYSTYYEYINKLLDTFSVSISKKLINLFIDSEYKAEFISNFEEKGNYSVD